MSASAVVHEHEYENAGPSSDRHQREITVVLVGPRPSPHALAFGRGVALVAGLPLHAVVLAPTEMRLTGMAEQLGMPSDALDGVILHFDVGDPAERVVAYANAHPGAALVVSGGDPDAGHGLAPAASRLLFETSAPVFVIRRAVPERIARILVPLDGTPSTAAALGPAVQFARETGASLEIVLVGQAGQLASEPGAMGPPHYVDQPQHEWAEFTHEFLDRFLGGIAHVPPEVAARLYVGAGEPAQEIRRFEETLHPDLLVLVWHGDATGDHGSVFQSVLGAVRCPVLVLRR